MVRISIIIVTYNSGKTIKDTLESIIKQTYHNYEIIIKDGGSSDDTLDICHRYVPLIENLKESAIRIINSKDNGIYNAMNQGVMVASGELIGLLNSDDFYTSDDVLQTVANEFELNQDVDAFYGDVHYVKADDITKIIRYYSSKRFKRWMMRLGFMPAHPSFYCRKSIYEKYRLCSSETGSHNMNEYYNTTYTVAADFEFMLRLIFVNRIKIRYINMDFVTMRTGGISSSGIKSHRQINCDHMRAFKENGVYSNYLLISIRYIYKVIELLCARVFHK